MAVTDVHPNLALLSRLDLTDLASGADVFAPGVVWHYFNPKLPELEGDYVGLDGLHTFFEKLGVRSRGSFRVQPISLTPIGDELVVVRTRNTLTLEGDAVATDVVLVWRIVEGRVTEVWDIPSAFTESTLAAASA